MHSLKKGDLLQIRSIFTKEYLSRGAISIKLENICGYSSVTASVYMEVNTTEASRYSLVQSSNKKN